MKSIIPLILLFLISCTAKYVPVDNSWEGIRGNTLRIAVYQFTADEENENKIKGNIIEAAKSRGALLLVSYASIKIDRSRVSTSSDEILNSAISEIIGKGNIIFHELRESGYTLAFVEFDITPLTSALEIINRNN
jgi:hypothetical protein